MNPRERSESSPGGGRVPPGYRTQSPDTSYEVEQILIASLRRMSLAEKAELLSRHCQAISELAVVGIRMRYPEADEREIWFRLMALRLGPELAKSAYGWDVAQKGY